MLEILSAVALGFLFGALVVVLLYVDYRSQVSRLDALLAAERERNTDLMDRWYLSKNLPPAGVDVKAKVEKREQDAEARRDRPRPSTSPLARAHSALATEEKRQQGQG